MDNFTTTIARKVGARLAGNCPNFSESAFVESAGSAGLGGWVSRISAALRSHLPRDFPSAVEILLRSVGSELPPEDPMPEAHSFTPIVHFVVVYGREHFDLSMNTLHALSKRTYTAQAGVRRWLIENPDSTMRVLGEWVHDSSPHVRRLVVNATRPRLRYPVMPGLSDLRRFRDDPEPVLRLLDHLRDDPSETVRRAVAGSLSDIAKDNPDVAYERIKDWLGHGGKETRQIARNALRYGSRKEDARALKLLDQAKSG
ncbi:MAG: DNA alkylation repair protein [Verrucomicrobiales bacterium]|nr:DNA alkylation repair protein [Verrucomicrobiales bacterium]